MERRIAEFDNFSVFLTMNALLLGIYVDKGQRVVYLRLFCVYIRIDDAWQWEREYDMTQISGTLMFRLNEEGQMVEHKTGKEFTWNMTLVIIKRYRLKFKKVWKPIMQLDK